MGNWAEIILANTGSGTYVPPSNAPNVSFAAAPTVSWVPYGHDWIPWLTFTLNLPTADPAYTNLRDIQITRIGPDTLDATGKRLVLDTIPHDLFVGTSITLKYDLPPISEYSVHTWKIVASVRNDLTITSASAPSQMVTVTPPQVASVTASEKFTSTLGDLRYHPDDGAGLMTQLLVTPTLTFQPGTQQSVTIWTVYDWGGTFGIRTTFKGWSWISGTSLAVTFSGNEGLWVTTKASTTVTVRCAVGAIDPLAPIPAGAASTTFTLYGPGGAAGLGNTDITGSLLGVNYFRKSGGSDWGWKGITGTNPVKADVWFARFYEARGTWDSGTQTWTDDSGYCPLNAETGRYDWNVGDSEDDTVTTARDAGGNPIPGQPFTTVASPPLDFAPPGATTNKQFCLRVKIFSRKDLDPGIDGAFWTGTAPTYAEYSTDHKICIITPDSTKAGLSALDIQIGQGLYVDDAPAIVENTGWNPSQMMPNPSFEDGALGGMPSGYVNNGGQIGTSVLVSSPTLSGTQALRLIGSHSQILPTQLFILRAASTGADAFFFECWIQSSGVSGPGVFRVAFFWYDSTNNTDGTPHLMAFNTHDTTTFPGSTWTKFTYNVQAPVGCARFNVDFGTSGDTSGGSWFVDNVLLRPILPGDVLQHGSTVGVDTNGNLAVNVTGLDGITVAGTNIVIPRGGISSDRLAPGSLGNFQNGFGDLLYGPGATPGTPPATGAVRPIALVFGFPTVPNSNYPQGAIIFNLNDGKMYRNGGGVVTAVTMTSIGTFTGTPNFSVTMPGISGGGGAGASVKFNTDSSGHPIASSAAIGNPGSGFTGTFSITMSSYGNIALSFTVLPATTSSSGAWAGGHWVVGAEPLDILAGAIAANVGYFGTINAQQVNAGTFTGFHFVGCDLVLNLSGITTTINNYVDANIASLLMGVKVSDNTSGNYAALGSRRLAFRLASTGLNAAQLGADPDPGTGNFGGVLSLSAQHRSWNWSDGGGLQVIGPGGSGTATSGTINYAKAGGGTGFMQFIDGILTSFS